jgi:hypothetical protein
LHRLCAPSHYLSELDRPFFQETQNNWKYRHAYMKLCPWSTKSQFIFFNLSHYRGSSIYVYKSCSNHIVPYLLKYTIKQNKGTQSNHQTSMHILETFTEYPTLIYSYSSISQGMRILIYYKWQPSN